MGVERPELLFGSVQRGVWEQLTEDQRIAVLIVQSQRDPLQFVEAYQEALEAGVPMPDLEDAKACFTMIVGHA